MDGIYLEGSAGSITNSEVYDNGSDGNNYYGITLITTSSSVEVRNCTIVENDNKGIYRSGGSVVGVVNSIIRYNNDEGDQMYGVGSYYNCCITDPNDLQGSSQADDNWNITCAPGFAYPGVCLLWKGC